MCVNIDHFKSKLFAAVFRFLDDIPASGECAREYVALYNKLITQDHWRYYLVLHGVLSKLELLIKQVGRGDTKKAHLDQSQEHTPQDIDPHRPDGLVTAKVTHKAIADLHVYQIGSLRLDGLAKARADTTTYTK